MGLSVGIIGLPNVGKSTLFNALTASQVEAANYPFATINPNKGTVQVIDERLTKLSEHYKSEKTIYATIEFNDIAGLVRGANKGEGLGNQFLGYIRECDVILEVVRCFGGDEIIHVEQSVDAKRDIEIINLELILKDLEVLYRRKERVETKARVNKDKESIFELEIVNKLIPALENEIPARLVASLTQAEKEHVKLHFGLLTIKPIIYVANISDIEYATYEENIDYQKVKAIANQEGAEVVAISAEIEAEIANMPRAEQELYLKELGIDEPGLHKVINVAYKMLGLSSFFTIGKDEVRAWTFKNGTNAQKCAGLVHTDFERGFIRAEIYSYSEFEKYGTEAKIKEAGKMRSEGKDYLMRDGDIAFFKFNVRK
ncbi:MAG: Ribosome-binding ATPase YchF [Tenericutes bacterium ADurb.Bin239]|nr:MAG: Ribosome-binding ATPase YchF [Tenericutes bacterium ADurb.Bin239]